MTKPLRPIDRRSAIRNLTLGSAALLASHASSALARSVFSTDISGPIRVCGSPRMRELIDVWADAFARRHPGVFFDVDLKGTATAQFMLQHDVADIAFSNRQAFDYEQYGIYRRSQALTTEVPVATGSHDKIGKSAALAVYVHEDNPIAAMSLEQLDGVFGAQREGGWGTMYWDQSVARGASFNIRTWGQLGLKGAWAKATVVPFAPPALSPGGRSFFQVRVLGGADTVNEATREYADRFAMIADLSRERFGIAYASLGYAQPGVRAIPLSDTSGQRPVALTRETVADGSYPLSRHAYIYAVPDTPAGDPKPLDPKLLAFLTFVLSPEGQDLVRGTDYNPLSPGFAGDLVRHLAETPKVFRIDE